MDGATNFQAFCKVVVPLAAPGLATTAILTFIAAWNEFLLAITLTSSTGGPHGPGRDRVLHGLDAVRAAAGHASRAASVIISIPLIVLVLLFQKRIVAGLTAGAVKG